MGATFPVNVTETRIDRHEDSPSHILAISPYTPGETYRYYWGFAWDKTDIDNIDDWNDHLARQAATLRSPLKIEIKK